MSVLQLGKSQKRGASRGNTRGGNSRGGGTGGGKGGNSYRKAPARKAAEPRRSMFAGLLGRAARLLGLPALAGWSWVLCKRALIIGASLAVCIGLSLGLFAVYRALAGWTYFGLNRVVIEGTERLENHDILEIAGLRFGRNVVGIDIWEAQARLAANPWVRSASVRRILPDSIYVRLEERPASYWVRSGEALCYADENGAVIEEIASDRFAALPLLDLEPECKPCQREMKAFRQALADNDLFFSQREVAEIKVRGEEGLSVYLDGQALTINVEIADWRADLAKVRRVWDDLQHRGELARTRSITVRGDKVWARLSPAAPAAPADAHPEPAQAKAPAANSKTTAAKAKATQRVKER